MAELRGRLQARVSNSIKQAILKRRMPMFKKLVSEDKAWALYIYVIEKYIRKAKAKKMAVNLAKINVEDLEALKRLDTEINTMEWLIKIPQRSIDRALVTGQEELEKELIETTKEEQKNE